MRKSGLEFAAILTACFAVTTASAQPSMTSDVLNFVGGDVTSGQADDETVVRLGMVSWTAREGPALPVTLTLLGRGLHQILFFDPAPLIDVDAVSDEASLRIALRLGASEPLPPQDPLSVAAPVAAMRGTVRTQMRAFGLNSLGDVAAMVACQRQVDGHAGSVSEVLGGLLACGPSFPKDARDVRAIVQFVRQRSLLTPILRSSAASVDRRHVAGYVLESKNDAVVVSAGEVHAAAMGARDENILTLAFSEPKTFFQGDGAKLFIPPVFTLLGILATAAIGFQVFRAQQAVQFEYFGRQQQAQFDGYLRQQQYQEERAAADRFQQRKYEKFTQLEEFFRATYPPFIRDPRVTPEDIRTRLVGANVYSILPADAAANLNAICDGNRDRAEAVREIDELVRKEFREFMQASR